MAHSEIGASKCKRWMSCPGSVALCKEITEPKSSSFAVEGTVAHELAEATLNNDWDRVDLVKKVGLKVKKEGFVIKITEEMIEAVLEYAQIIREDYAKLFPEEKAGEHKNLVVEKKFNLKEIDKKAFGTSDAVIMKHFGKLVVYDFKYGKGVRVDAEENEQMLYYALGSYLESDFGEIEIVIIQPRIEYGISRWSTTVQRLNKFATDLKAAIAETRKPDAKLFASEKGCKFCPAMPVCPEQKKLVTRTAISDFEKVEAPKEAKLLSMEEITQVLAKAKLIENWLSSVKGYAHEQAQQGKNIPGYKLVDSYGNRAWKDTKEVENRFKKEFKDKIYVSVVPKLKSPAQLEKVVGKGEVAELVQKPYKGTILVPLDDKRPEASNAIEADFDIVEN